MKDAATKSYLKKGQDIVDMNHKAIDIGATAYQKIDVPADWADAQDEADTRDLQGRPEVVKMVKDVMEPIGRMDGDSLPVSAFAGEHVDGSFEHGAAAYEKRGVAVTVPQWNEATCVQCNQCAYVCPHATIRPFALTEEEAAAAPASTKLVDIKAGKARAIYKYTMAVSPLDCMGCGVCIRRLPDQVPQDGTAGRGSCSAGCIRLLRSKGFREGRHDLHELRKGFASSRSRCLSSPVPAQAVQRPLTPPDHSGLRRPACTSPTLPAVRPFGAARLLPPRTPLMQTATVRHGLTPCSRITQSTALACTMVRKLSVSA